MINLSLNLNFKNNFPILNNKLIKIEYPEKNDIYFFNNHIFKSVNKILFSILNYLYFYYFIIYK
jgi:hypothetical protein